VNTDRERERFSRVSANAVAAALRLGRSEMPEASDARLLLMIVANAAACLGRLRVNSQDALTVFWDAYEQGTKMTELPGDPPRFNVGRRGSANSRPGHSKSEARNVRRTVPSFDAAGRPSREGDEAVVSAPVRVIFRCSKCTAIYEVTQQRRPVRVSGMFRCYVCREVLHSWAGEHDFLDWKAIDV
jgi:hypothetical protein